LSLCEHVKQLSDGNKGAAKFMGDHVREIGFHLVKLLGCCDVFKHGYGARNYPKYVSFRPKYRSGQRIGTTHVYVIRF